jgi:hypothetical protein
VKAAHPVKRNRQLDRDTCSVLMNFIPDVKKMSDPCIVVVKSSVLVADWRMG